MTAWWFGAGWLVGVCTGLATAALYLAAKRHTVPDVETFQAEDSWSEWGLGRDPETERRRRRRHGRHRLPDEWEL